MITQIDIKKYIKKPLSELKKLATKYFNAWVRKRDEDKGCISCDSPYFEDAGHLYSGNSHSMLKYHEFNVNGQCSINCNNAKHGNEKEYRKGLENRIGKDNLKKLDALAVLSKRTPFKWDKMDLIEIIIKYKEKLKQNMP